MSVCLFGFRSHISTGSSHNRQQVWWDKPMQLYRWVSCIVDSLAHSAISCSSVWRDVFVLHMSTARGQNSVFWPWPWPRQSMLSLLKKSYSVWTCLIMHPNSTRLDKKSSQSAYVSEVQLSLLTVFFLQMCYHSRTLVTLLSFCLLSLLCLKVNTVIYCKFCDVNHLHFIYSSLFTDM